MIRLTTNRAPVRPAAAPSVRVAARAMAQETRPVVADAAVVEAAVAATRKFKHPAHGLARHVQRHDYGRALDLDYAHPAVVQGRSLFASTVKLAAPDENLLVPGANNPKIGRKVTKGAWAGMPIYTLTLEERATCPRSCHHWRTCYGNGMPMARRNPAGPAFEQRLERDVRALGKEHPAGFVVRCHVLGDFYSLAYVALWQRLIEQTPVRVFGYTAHRPDTEIGLALEQLATSRWDRFALRRSVPTLNAEGGMPVALAYWMGKSAMLPARVGSALVCPAQREATATCGTCTMCWSTRAPIAFAVHGFGSRGRPRGKSVLSPRDGIPMEG